ncbi:uncharacterized protein RCC_03702 [Ramularia collo-cygni]|uniref:Uncharacterized protein n=1 Tax=Ramularia collo-cygni TaxID=112498 RepID=A0A2D3V2V9_9PEZI|nr:uncharacterized protein RCC_03702 [Ramularia collo-cygni]CZT17866.1 uncharacterized protein RCC_03702 [Ramularia collo-cygni]
MMIKALSFCFIATANAFITAETTNTEALGTGGPPEYLASRSDFGGTTWTEGSLRPSDGRSSSWSPFIPRTGSKSHFFGHPFCSITVTSPGVVSISTVIVTSIITQIEVTTHILSVPTTTTITDEWTSPTIHSRSSPACEPPGTTPAGNAAYCNGKGCEITFDKGAIVHWELLTNRTALVTHYLHNTCMDVVCNTMEFNLYYSRSATSCDRPPCPSNSLNCECNIVVGPFVLPDGRITTVTQTGPSGWNLNLGPTATAHNIARCGTGGAECLEASTTTLFTPLVYTDHVKVLKITHHRNNSKHEATAFLLPKLAAYFPANYPLGQCTNIKLSLPLPTPTALSKRDDVATVGGDGVTTWPGCATLTDDSVAKRGLMARQESATKLPICSSRGERKTETVTASPWGPGTTTSAVESRVRSEARRWEVRSCGWVVWFAVAWFIL